MAYLKDVKLCADCTFYGTPQGQRDRCLHPDVTYLDLVNGHEIYPYCHAERSVDMDGHCGSKGVLFILNADQQADRLQRRAEFEEAMRDFPEK